MTCFIAGFVFAWAWRAAAAEVRLPQPNRSEPISVTAQAGTRWAQGAYEVWVLQGDCRIQQGSDSASGNEAVLWILRQDVTAHKPHTVLAYLEGNVAIDIRQDGARTRLTDQAWFGRLATVASIEVRPGQVSPPPPTPPPIFGRATAQRDAAAGRVGPTSPVAAPPPATSNLPPGTRRIRVFPRSDVRTQVQWYPDRQTNQWIGVIDSGVNLIVEGLTAPERPGTPRLLGATDIGTIDVSTDRMVLWTSGVDLPELGNQLQPSHVPLEVYMEGNIVFRQGDREIRADRMYYDVANQVGTVLRAELLTDIPKYEGKLRLRAEVIRQLSRDEFYAEHAFVTSSRMGAPTYRLQAGRATLEDRRVPVIDPATGAPAVNPETGEVETVPERLVTAENDFLFLDDFPIFYWPTLSTNLEDSSLYVRRIRFRHDSVFGTQALVDLNMYQILGLRRPPLGSEWDASIDYLSLRGLGHGTKFSYNREGFLGIPGPAAGLWDYWGIQDRGNDDLGLDRRNVPPERSYRYRLFGQHRQMLSGDVQFSAALGVTSDRNFLEQYYEREWYEMKDEITGIEFKRIRDNTSWSVTADYRLNDFVTQTDWLPRGDHFWLGQSLLGDRLTWYEHTSLGYAQFRALSPPAPAQNPGDKFRFLPWEVNPATGAPVDARGERFVTRQEIDLPFQLGVVKFVPYAMGEFGHWGEDLTGQSLDRLYGQVGMRASVPMWRVDPTVQSVLWNLNGLAHKVVFDAEFSFADANRNLTQLPLYEPLDDQDIEAFRRRFVPNTFPAPLGSIPPAPAIPLMFDERFYALRTGMAGWVTAPSSEIADDLMAFRLGMRNRWQTKRGAPGEERIVDWITFDTNVTLFPKADHDNFGQTVGLLDYDARWQVGDRLALLSSGIFDFFPEGQRIVSVGTFLERPPQSGLYLGVILLDGPISNTVLAMSYSYRMSPKWVSAVSAAIDLRSQGNIGENVTITRVGESFLISGGFHADVSRGSYGASFSIEPRFLPKTRLGQAGGARIPTAGAFGLE